MKTNLKFGLAALAGILWLSPGFAQKTDAIQQEIPKAPANVAIDGELTEWGDTLSLYNKENRLKYTIATDNNNLYVVAYIKDREVKQKIMAGGITIAINTEGKKRKTYSVTYPAPVDDNTDQAAMIGRAHTFKVDGFKGVDDKIKLPDEHGFNGLYTFDENGGLAYETAIPLKLLNIKPGVNNVFINIRLNGVEDSSIPVATPTETHGRRGGRGGGAGSTSSTQQPDEPKVDMHPTDFWLNYTLTAK